MIPSVKQLRRREIMENVLGRMERVDGKKKIADFIVKKKQDYEKA